MLALDQSIFPRRHDKARGWFRAIQAELLPGSGERLTIGVVGQIDGRWRTAVVPNLDRLSRAYGPTTKLLKEAADAVASSLQDLTSEHPIEAVILPLQSLSWSPLARTITGNDWRDALNAGLGQSSLLAAFHLARFELKTHELSGVARPAAGVGTKREIKKQVLAGIERQAPQLARYMREYRSEAPVDSPEFVGERTIAEFAVLRAGHLENDITDLQGSLWRLDNFRGGQRNPVAFVCTDETVGEPSTEEILNRIVEQAKRRQLELRRSRAADRIVTDLMMIEAT